MALRDLIDCEDLLAHVENAMHAQSIISKTLSKALLPMHAVRREAVLSAVVSSLKGQVLTVTALGRGLDSGVDEKHQIKRMDRLLSNRHLHAQRVNLYAGVARLIIGACARPVIAVDWSDLDGAKRHYLLRASLVMNGRALTLYEEVHTLATKEKPRTHRLFLQRLHDIVPDTARPVVLTDAGFRTPWFRQVSALGWDYLGRVRNRHKFRYEHQKHWLDAKTLYPLATTCAKDIGPIELTQSNPLAVRCVLVRQPKRGRHKRNLSGQRARSKRSEKYAAREREPWLLVTSLYKHQAAAKRIVHMYGGRMQIEEAFRDLKSQRFGLGFEQSRSKTTHRIAILMLIAMLTLLVAWLIGTAVELSGQQRRFQANTERKRKVLSSVFIAKRAVHDPRIQVFQRHIHLATLNLARWVNDVFYAT